MRMSRQEFRCTDGENAFFDMVFHAHASTYENIELPHLYRLHECAKKFEDVHHLSDIEHGFFIGLHDS